VEIEASGEVGGHDGGEPRRRGMARGAGEEKRGDGKAAEGGEGGFSCFIS